MAADKLHEATERSPIVSLHTCRLLAFSDELRGVLKRRKVFKEAEQCFPALGGDAAPLKLLRHSFAPDLVQLVERDERVRALVGRNARGFEHAREHLPVVEADGEVRKS